MRLGENGAKWISSLDKLFTDSSSLCTNWQIDFFQSYMDKSGTYGVGAYVTEKQLAQLNKIADALGLTNIEKDELDNEED